MLIGHVLRAACQHGYDLTWWKRKGKKGSKGGGGRSRKINPGALPSLPPSLTLLAECGCSEIHCLDRRSIQRVSQEEVGELQVTMTYAQGVAVGHNSQDCPDSSGSCPLAVLAL